MKITYLKGLPASGKSTWAKQEIVKSNGKIKRINKDDLRELLDAGKWSGENEKLIVKTERLIAEHIMSKGYDLIVDNTGFNDTHKEYYKNIAQKYDAIFEVKLFDVDIKKCIERDLKRPNSVGQKVITDMYNKYLRPVAKKYIPPEEKPTAILVGIDGTLGHHSGRSPYEWHRVGEDTVDDAIAGIVRHYYIRDPNDDNPEPRIIIVSGRDGICEPETRHWLKDNNIPYDTLLMRTKDDNRKDSIIKRELFDNHIRDNYKVLFLLDDRNQVVDMYRDMGLKVLQVEPGNF